MASVIDSLAGNPNIMSLIDPAQLQLQMQQEAMGNWADLLGYSLGLGQLPSPGTPTLAGVNAGGFFPSTSPFDPNGPTTTEQSQTGWYTDPKTGERSPTLAAQEALGSIGGQQTLASQAQQAGLTGLIPMGLPGGGGTTFASQNTTGWVRQPDGSYAPTTGEQGVVQNAINSVLGANSNPADPFSYISKLNQVQNNQGALPALLRGGLTGATGKSMDQLQAEPNMTNIQLAGSMLSPLGTPQGQPLLNYMNGLTGGSASNFGGLAGGGQGAPQPGRAYPRGATQGGGGGSLGSGQFSGPGQALYDAQGNLTGYQGADGSISGPETGGAQALAAQAYGGAQGGWPFPNYQQVDVPSGIKQSEAALGPVSWNAGQKIFTDPNGYGFVETPSQSTATTHMPGADWMATGQQTGFTPDSFNQATSAGNSTPIPGAISPSNFFQQMQGGSTQNNPYMPAQPAGAAAPQGAGGGGKNQLVGQLLAHIGTLTNHLANSAPVFAPSGNGGSYAQGLAAGASTGGSTGLPTGWGSSQQDFNKLVSPTAQGAITSLVANAGGEQPTDFMAGMKASSPEFAKASNAQIGTIGNF